MITLAPNSARHQFGITLVELLVALAVGSFLMIGAMQIFSQSRQTFIINESIAGVQDTAQFALDTIENDLRMANNWGRSSRSQLVEGRSVAGNPNPNNLPVPIDCGAAWALDLALAVDGANNRYTLPCLPRTAAQENSDVITVRRASVDPVAVDDSRLQIQTTRIQGEIFNDSVPPAAFSVTVNPNTGAPASSTHNLVVSSYYVASDSDLAPGVPTLRRKRLATYDGRPSVIDEEIAPGVENIQLQLGIDIDNDNAVDRYVNPGDGIYDPSDTASYIPGAKVLTARIWLLVRGVRRENGIVDNRNYTPGDVHLGSFDDDYRRMQVSKTILLRNTRI
jgi:type IV pilus assembly protein PilW